MTEYGKCENCKRRNCIVRGTRDNCKNWVATSHAPQKIEKVDAPKGVYLYDHAMNSYLDIKYEAINELIELAAIEASMPSAEESERASKEREALKAQALEFIKEKRIMVEYEDGSVEGIEEDARLAIGLASIEDLRAFLCGSWIPYDGSGLLRAVNKK